MWLYEGTAVEEIPDGFIGYVYLITNTVTGKQYIGKKHFTFSKTSYKIVTQKNGVKKKRRIKKSIESDWKDYWSSSEELKQDVLKYGTDKFIRTILKYCRTKSETSYFEAKYQFEYDVLLNPNQWYNSWISVRVRRNQLGAK